MLASEGCTAGGARILQPPHPLAGARASPGARERRLAPRARAVRAALAAASTLPLNRRAAAHLDRRAACLGGRRLRHALLDLRRHGDERLRAPRAFSSSGGGGGSSSSRGTGDRSDAARAAIARTVARVRGARRQAGPTCSTLVEFLAEVSKKGMPSDSANSLAVAVSTTCGARPPPSAL